MQQDQSKVIFLICDDDQDYRDGNKNLVSRVLKLKLNVPVPHESHIFDDGSGPLDFLKTKGNSKGVILISDYEMPAMNGGELFRKLDAINLLPDQTFLCSGMNRDVFQTLIIDGLGIPNAENKIRFIPKNDPNSLMAWNFGQKIPGATQAAAKEIGIDLALRPQAQAPANSGKRGAKPQ